MGKIIFLLSTLFTLGCTTLSAQKIIISATAENAGEGAVARTKDNIAYLLEGVEYWPDSVLNRVVIVSGFLKETDWRTDTIQDNMPLTITGTAGSRKESDVLTAGDVTYFVDNIVWGDLHGETVTITGTLHIVRIPPEKTVNEAGEEIIVQGYGNRDEMERYHIRDARIIK